MFNQLHIHKEVTIKAWKEIRAAERGGSYSHKPLGLSSDALLHCTIHQMRLTGIQIINF